jgi:integrase
LKTGELLLLRIRDVLDDSGEVRSHIKLRDREILIPEILKPDLKSYHNHLRKEGHPAGKNAYLFPITKSRTGKGKENTFAARRRKWHRDVKELSDIYNVHEKIRQAGIREYFGQLPQNYWEKDRIKKAAEFAGCSVAWVEIVLRKGAPCFQPRETRRERRGY